MTIKDSWTLTLDVQVSLQQYKTLCDAQQASIERLRNQVAELTKGTENRL